MIGDGVSMAIDEVNVDQALKTRELDLLNRFQKGLLGK